VPFDPRDPTSFRQVLGQYPTGVCVVTASGGEGARAGFVVGSFTSVSLDPPLVAFFPDRSSTSWPKIEAAGRFCVNILAADQEDVCRRFASKAADKFEGVTCRETPSGAPIIEGAVAWIDCELELTQDTGDHFLVLGLVTALDIESSSLPLLFFQGGYGRFAPLSFAAANPGGALTKQLRDVDLVRREMERLAQDVSARCIATSRVDDELVVTASAGGLNTSAAATLVGQRLPFAPSTGATFAAWMDPPEIEAWIAPIVPAAARDAHRERLAAVRARGFSVGLRSEAQRRFAYTLEQLAVAPGSVESDILSGLIRELPHDPIELSHEVKNAIRTITAPVFGPDGRVALSLALYGFPNPSTIGGIERLAARVREAAAAATDRLGGRVPRAAPLQQPPTSKENA
jgi:flavin reductase (DIM6/NTAB) family NADH-FMN oxidoreductase RutF/DNA-binding IclR family transcriptional regulator